MAYFWSNLNSGSLSQKNGSPPYFYFRFGLWSPRGALFLPYSGLYCRGIVHRRLEKLSIRKPGSPDLNQRPRLSICPKVGQSTQLLPVLQIHFSFDHDDFLHAFFELRSISRLFGPFRVLSGHRFRSGAPCFLTESFSSRRCTILRQYRRE